MQVPEVIKSSGVDLLSEHVSHSCISEDVGVEKGQAKSEQPKSKSKHTEVMFTNPTYFYLQWFDI